MFHMHTFNTLSSNFNLCIVLGKRKIHFLEANFVDDIWSKLPKGVASKMSRSVVSLASFNGDGSVVVITFPCFNKWVMINN
mgnify:CR=1 FL=1